MIVTVGLKREALHEARRTGKVPDFGNVFSDVAGVRLMGIFGRGRYADFEMTHEAFNALCSQYATSFSFAKERTFEPF